MAAQKRKEVAVGLGVAESVASAMVLGEVPDVGSPCFELLAGAGRSLEVLGAFYDRASHPAWELATEVVGYGVSVTLFWIEGRSILPDDGARLQEPERALQRLWLRSIKQTTSCRVGGDDINAVAVVFKQGDVFGELEYAGDRGDRG